MDNMRGVSIAALRKGMQDVGVKDGEVLLFSDLMDSVANGTSVLTSL